MIAGTDESLNNHTEIETMTNQTTLAAAIAASNAAHSPGTQIYKHRDGWRAEDRIPLGAAKGGMGKEGTRMLHIDTHKTSRGGLVTHASVMVHTPDGGMSCVLFGDFSERLMQSNVKCTEKAVRTQHEHVMREYAGSLPDRVRAFYSEKERVEAHAPSALDPQFAPALAEAGCTG